MQENDVALPQSSKVRDTLIEHLQEAYAMENQIVEVLEEHAKDADGHPVLQQHIVAHLEETKQHRDRIEERLRAYGTAPSAVKGAVSNMMGSVAGKLAGARKEPLARNARDEYVTEHLEIAAYALLIATARAAGDGATIRACEMNLRDEMRMAHWLELHLVEPTLLDYESAGLGIPPEVGREAIATWHAALQGAHWDAQPVESPTAPAAGPETGQPPLQRALDSTDQHARGEPLAPLGAPGGVADRVAGVEQIPPQTTDVRAPDTLSSLPIPPADETERGAVRP